MGASADYDPVFFAGLAAIEDGHFWFEARSRLIVDALRRLGGGLGRFLEIGCGTGFVLRAVRRAFPAAELSGSEVWPEAFAFAKKRVPDARFEPLDARRMPYRDRFDAIGAFDVLEHIEEDEAVLRSMRDALVPGGVLLLTVPQHRALWSPVDEEALHKRRYSRAELVEKVRGAGLVVVRVTSFVTLLLPLMFLARFFKRRRSGEDKLAEFRISPAVNAALSAVMALEVWLVTRLGLSLPCGGSLLLAARRPD